MPKLTINGTEIEVPAGTSILQAAEMLGYEIPRFCYHDRLSVPANCRMCLVEVKGAPKPVASCAMAAGEGMEVSTEMPMAQKARRSVMEMLLINHPLDCPICDQGGECDLQDQAVSFGFDRSRYTESKRAVKDKEFGPLVKTVMTRCIQCTRCVRFASEIAGTPDLGFLNRGEDAEIGTLVEKTLSSELSGNLIDVCPVGALTSKPYAFQARPWELTRTETIDAMDAVGTNIRVDSRGNEVLRVVPRLHEEINEEWCDDRTRFACDGLKRARLDQPFVRDAETRNLRPASWEEAFGVIASRLPQVASDRVAAYVGDLCDLEAMVALKDLMTGMGVSNLECRVDGALFDTATRAGYLFNSGIAALEEADAILLVGVDPRREAAIVNARIRKGWVNNRTKIALIGEPVSLNYPVTQIGTGPEALDLLAGNGHAFADVLKAAQKPVMIVGMGTFQRPDGVALHAKTRDVAEALGIVREGWNGYNVLHTAAARVGALEIGFVPGSADGFDPAKMDAVWLMGVDEHLVSRISRDAFVVYQGHHGDVGAARADVVLPGAAYTEKDATWVNMEGRPQVGRRAVFPPGEAREDWKILRAVSERIGRKLPYDSLAELRGRIVREWPRLGAIDTRTPATWTAFGKAGNVVPVPLRAAVRNFYRTNIITRVSATMAECSVMFGPSDEQQVEAAE